MSEIAIIVDTDAMYRLGRRQGVVPDYTKLQDFVARAGDFGNARRQVGSATALVVSPPDDAAGKFISMLTGSSFKCYVKPLPQELLADRAQYEHWRPRRRGIWPYDRTWTETETACEAVLAAIHYDVVCLVSGGNSLVDIASYLKRQFGTKVEGYSFAGEATNFEGFDLFKTLCPITRRTQSI